MVLYDHADNPIPVGAITGYFQAEDGATLRFARWAPQVKVPLGTICLLQGRAEFIEKYFETVRDLLIRGFAVATFDWRGQGGSARIDNVPNHGHVEDFADYGADLDAFVSQILLPTCPAPYYGVAHSTGGAVLLHNAPTLRTKFRRLVLFAPLLGFGEHGFPNAVIDPLSRVLVTLGLGLRPVPGAKRHILYVRPFPENRLTSDERRYERIRNLVRSKPDLMIGAPTIGWVRAATRAMRDLEDPDFVERIRIPLLVIAAGHDRVVSNAATERFARTIKAGHLVTVPGAEHELLQEADVYREQALAAFDAFVPGS